MLKFFFHLLAATLCLTVAHDLYLIPQNFYPKPGETLLLSVHSGDSFPNSEGTVDPTRLIAPRIGGEALSGFAMLDLATHTTWTATAGKQWFSLSTRTRVLELEKSKFLSYVRGEGLGKVVATVEKLPKAGPERYSKYAKAYVSTGSGTYNGRPLGLLIEIMAESDPELLAPGGNLPIQVLLRGKPMADAQIIRTTVEGKLGKHEVVGRTDKSGRLVVPITEKGAHRLHAIHMEDCEDQAAARWESFWASLTFSVK